MKMAAALHAGVATHPGLHRAVNEDRVWVEEERGILLVVDGLGGHAAGEMAAETAVSIIRERLASDRTNVEEQIQLAIAEANNEIFRLGRSNDEWQGMACVLTLAVVDEDHVIAGHVGDSRLYLVWNGHLRKLTSDHSPVGEQEDGGVLTEEEAMRHPRRNEVFRDVGSRLHEPGDPQFVETKRFLFRPDAALLLCSDGLSDVLTSAQISAIVEQFDGDPQAIAQQLVDAANEAGGIDNVTVIFYPGPEFVGVSSPAIVQSRARHAVTRIRQERTGLGSFAIRLVFLLMGVALGIVFWMAAVRWILPGAKTAKEAVKTSIAPAHIAVNPADPFGLVHALMIARAGDTVDVPSGQYFGPIHMKSQVNVIGARGALVTPDPAALTDAGIAIVARGIEGARIQGLRVTGDATHPMKTGVLISDSAIEMDDVDISGSTDAGVRIDGKSRGALLANFIHGNAGSGVIVGGESSPRLVGNRISDDGKTGPVFHPGIEIAPTATPVLENNTVVQNGSNGRPK